MHCDFPRLIALGHSIVVVVVVVCGVDKDSGNGEGVIDNYGVCGCHNRVPVMASIIVLKMMLVTMTNRNLNLDTSNLKKKVF